MSLTKGQIKEIVKLCAQHNLIREEHIFEGEDYWLVSRNGISKLRTDNSIKIKMSLVHYSPKHAVIHAEGSIVDLTPSDDSSMPAFLKSERCMDTFGEASPENNTFIFPVAIAEKRAESRIVLELLGLYDQGVRGEEEFKYYPKPKTMEGKGDESLTDTLERIKKKKKEDGRI